MLQAAAPRTALPLRRRIRYFSSNRCSSSGGGGGYGELSAEDVSHFRGVLGEAGVVQDAAALEAFNTDWLGQYRGRSRLALRPGSTAEVSAVLAHCHQRRLAVVPQGGNTGLVGGSVPVHDEVVLSLSRLDDIGAFEPASGILTCGAGCVLERLDGWLAERGHMMPLDLGAKGSCQIGGNVATNAGGVRLMRYGSLRGTVLGLEAVLADGTVVDALSSNRKDNTGYSLPQLLIGSEGTLGVVTAVSILTPRRPAAVNVALLGCATYADVLATHALAKARLGEVLSAVEFFDRGCVDVVLRSAAGSGGGAASPDPLAEPCPFYLLLETSGSSHEHDTEKLGTFLEAAMVGGGAGGGAVVCDGTIAQDGRQAAALWQLRETITPSLSAAGAVYKYDVSLPVPRLYELVEVMRERLGAVAAEQAEGVDGASAALQVVGFGHLGDGNLHLNISLPSGKDEAVFARIEPFVFEWVAAAGGSISAEHGIGQHKRDFLHLAHTDETVSMMRKLKDLFDPHGILNPYKVLPVQMAP